MTSSRAKAKHLKRKDFSKYKKLELMQCKNSNKKRKTKNKKNNDMEKFTCRCVVMHTQNKIMYNLKCA